MYKLFICAAVMVSTQFYNTSYASQGALSSPMTAWQPSYIVTDGLGVSVQWRGKMEQSATVVPMSSAEIQRQIDTIVDMGLGVVRIDNQWSWRDKEKGIYDFSEHHRVVDLCHKNGLRVLTILSFRDRRFEKSKRFSIKTKQGSKAYAEFCSKIVKEFKGQGIIWEMWNEPNAKPWGSIDDGTKMPVANAEAYMGVVTNAISSMRLVDPDCIVIGPGLAGFDPIFLEGCLNEGLLRYVDAVSIHPYHLRHLGAEVNSPRYETLRSKMIAYNKLNGTGHPLPPIVNSEIGYTQVLSPGNLHTQDQQAARIVRSILMAQVEKIPLHIIYTNLDRLHGNMKEPESNFGFMTYDGKPKSGFYAVKNLTTQLKDLRFQKRLKIASKKDIKESTDDYILLFSEHDNSVVVAWTIGTGHSVKLQLPGEVVEACDMKGANITYPKSDTEGLVKIELTENPIYIRIKKMVSNKEINNVHK